MRLRRPHVVPFGLRQVRIDVRLGEVAADDLEAERRSQREQEPQGHVHDGGTVRALVVHALDHVVATRDDTRLVLAAALDDARRQAADDVLALGVGERRQQDFFGAV